MSKINEDTLNNWTKPVSETEEEKLKNSINMVKNAIKEDEKLKNLNIEIFGQGSYANNTNVKLNSDIDLNVKFHGAFYYDLPKNKTKFDFGLNSPFNYNYQEFKNDVEKALINKFGKDRVKRNNKCITIKANSYIMETDVVPTWDNRKYEDNGNYIEGVAFWDDKGNKIINYPKQHIQNGINKNKLTEKKFKQLTRLFRKLRYKMIDENITINRNITSFLLECLVWNLPNNIFLDYDNWNDRLRNAIIFIYNETKDNGSSDMWCEVSELLYLFDNQRKWNKNDVNAFMVQLWQYLEYK